MESLKVPITELEVEIEIMSRSLSDFIKGAWHVLEPKRPFKSNWHIDIVSDHLEAVSRGEIQNLLINIPPGFMKSLTAAVFWPAWDWIENPTLRWIYGSYAQRLSTRDSVKCRKLIKSEWYQERFGDRFQISDDQDEKTKFENNQTGSRIATSIQGLGTGERADRIVVDDPHKVKEIESDTKRTGVITWWDEEMSTRGADPNNSAFVIIMQRIHEEDLAGHVLEQGGYEHLKIPMEYEPTKLVTCLGWEDPRKEKGELLMPGLYNKDQVRKLKKKLGPDAAAGQLQQDPAPADGIIFKRDWFRYWKELPIDEDGNLAFDMIITSWDLSFDGGKKTAFNVGQVWGKLDADYYLIKQARKQAEFTEQISMIKQLYGSIKGIHGNVIENKANAAAAISVLKKKIPALIRYNPKGDKEIRAKAQTPKFAGGNVFFPHPDIVAEELENPNDENWVTDMVLRFKKFPKAKYKDEIDTCTQALDWLDKNMPDGDWDIVGFKKDSLLNF